VCLRRARAAASSRFSAFSALRGMGVADHSAARRAVRLHFSIYRSNMKYKQHLTENIAPDYGPEPYLAYGDLDDIIRQLSSKAPAR
jgi:hypothetical protein